MLSKIVGSTKVFAARLDRALVRTFLGMGAIVTLEMLHPLEALTAVADVVFISRADNERRWTSVASAASGRGACNRTRDAAATTIEH